MTHPMLEKVARAMAKHASGYEWSDVPETGKTAFLGLARAAVQALLEPTRDMYDAGDEYIGFHGDTSDVDKIWRAMILPLLEGEGK